MEKMEDKRSYRRVKCGIAGSFKNLDSARHSSLVETTVNDISESGIRFRANELIPMHQRLQFRLNIPAKKPIDAVVQSSWVKELPHLSQFDIGGRFLTLSDEDRALIRQITK